MNSVVFFIFFPILCSICRF